MGAVYRARHRNLDRLAAIKTCLPKASPARFVREARILGGIKSPFIVGVYDFDILEDATPVLVMEWIDGADLAQVIHKEHLLTETVAVPLMRDVASGLEAAYELGVVHRDLKPSNILIGEKGRASVADFGLARDSFSQDNLSHEGALMGTPTYMAPEQADDPRTVDTRADIYSFGASFYHALTGEPPFCGKTAFSVIYQHKTAPLVSPLAKNPNLSKATVEILERCLAKSPHDRFGSFAEIRKLVDTQTTAESAWMMSDDAGLKPHLELYRSRRAQYLALTEGRAIDDCYTLPNGKQLRVTTGRIESQRVHAIVSSDDSELSTGGGVSRSIRLAGGPIIEQESRRYGSVQPGRAVVTSGGRLPARFVFHAVTIGFPVDGKGVTWVLPSRDLILELIASCFYHADSLAVESMAFPLLGTGAGGFDQDVCLDTMFQGLLKTLLRRVTRVQQVLLVLYRPMLNDGIWPRIARAMAIGQ